MIGQCKGHMITLLTHDWTVQRLHGYDKQSIKTEQKSVQATRNRNSEHIISKYMEITRDKSKIKKTSILTLNQLKGRQHRG